MRTRSSKTSWTPAHSQARGNASGSLALQLAISVYWHMLGGTIAPRSRYDPPPEGFASTPTDAERHELNRLRRSSAAPAAPVARAAALLPASDGVAYQDAARAVGRKSGAPSHLVTRFNWEAWPPRTPARRRPGDGLRRGGSRPHLRKVADADPGAGRDGDLVPLHAAPARCVRPRTACRGSRPSPCGGYSMTPDTAISGPALGARPDRRVRRRKAGTVTVTDPDAEPKKS